MKLIQFVLFPILICIFRNIQAQDKGPIARWKFEILDENKKITPATRIGREAPTIDKEFNIIEDVSGGSTRVIGNYFKLVPGVVGNALLLDGFTSYIDCRDVSAPKISGDFSIGVWIALGAYPTNWCPVADQSTIAEKGYFLGIDAYGHAGFKLYAGGKYFEIKSEERIPLRKWKHLEGVYSQDDGMALYLDGKLVASIKTEGTFDHPYSDNLLIGKHSIRQKPEGTLSPKSTEAVFTFFDGLIDELIIYNSKLSSKEIAEYVAQCKPPSEPSLVLRVLPSAPQVSDKFGAIYTTLKYHDAWDNLWRVGKNADVVVSFDDIPGKFIFWRGTSYIPNWITENGLWYNNEFTETWSDKGCHEPMSDKRCKFSHVRVLENSDARVVIHWRYPLVDNWENIARVDTLTGWGEWTDEVYTIYPDCVAVRKVTLFSSQPQSPHEFHEGIIVMGPGQRPEQVLQPSALTLANMEGETYSYSWEKGIPLEVDKNGFVHLPDKANIHLVNTKSQFKPFVIIDPKANPAWDIYRGSLRREVSMFPWWNHWPMAQYPSDGRNAMDSDQPSHSSISHANWDAYEQTENSVTKLMLNGLTEKSADKLVPLAKSWVSPAELRIIGSAMHVNEGYNPSERAYNLRFSSTGKLNKLDFILEANADSPVLNPCFVIKNWNAKSLSLKIDNRKIKHGKFFRYGFRNSLEGTDLIVWIKKESSVPVKFSLKPLAE